LRRVLLNPRPSMAVLNVSGRSSVRTPGAPNDSSVGVRRDSR
jgi:hypothetical protein